MQHTLAATPSARKLTKAPLASIFPPVPTLVERASTSHSFFATNSCKSAVSNIEEEGWVGGG